VVDVGQGRAAVDKVVYDLSTLYVSAARERERERESLRLSLDVATPTFSFARRASRSAILGSAF
jgi:hypothetical protein